MPSGVTPEDRAFLYAKEERKRLDSLWFTPKLQEDNRDLMDDMQDALASAFVIGFAAGQAESTTRGRR